MTFSNFFPVKPCWHTLRTFRIQNIPKTDNFPCFIWIRCRATWRERYLHPPITQAPAKSASDDSVIFRPDWLSSPWRRLPCSFFPALFYKWKTWLWNPFWVSRCWSISAWLQGAHTQGIENKAFWWSVPILFLNWLPGPLYSTCNDFCHVSMSERSPSQILSLPLKQVSG